jgi:hypothetical protein
VKLLLTSSGIANTTIHEALVGLLGKPVEESSALIIPTAIYPFPGGADHAWEAICGRSKSPFAGLGWKSLGVLELSVLPSIDEECWIPAVRETGYSARGQRRSPRYGHSRTMGREDTGADVRDRRPDRSQGDRRQRRSRLRGALEALHLLMR